MPNDEIDTHTRELRQPTMDAFPRDFTDEALEKLLEGRKAELVEGDESTVLPECMAWVAVEVQKHVRAGDDWAPVTFRGEFSRPSIIGVMICELLARFRGIERWGYPYTSPHGLLGPIKWVVVYRKNPDTDRGTKYRLWIGG